MKEYRSSLGNIKIHRRLISQIAELATKEVEGIDSLALTSRIWVSRLLSFFNISGIKVDISEEVKIEIPIIVKYGYNVYEVATALQETVLDNLLKSLNIDNASINIKVKGISYI